jgi:hypothetical protein
MKNKLSDLNNHLFMALERLNDEELTDEQLTKEAERARVIAGLATQIINGANLNLQAAKFIADVGNAEASEKIILQITSVSADA